MRLLADENIPRETIEGLRTAGFDISSVSEDNPGASDLVVLSQAEGEGRIVLTFDKDFGEIVFRQRSQALAGVILLRIKPRSPQYVTEIVRALLESNREWAGHFSVVTEQRIRMVPLPGA